MKSTGQERKGLKPIALHEIRAWICANLGLAQSVKDVARHFGVDAEVLRKRFYRVERESLSKYLIGVKLEEATRLAKETRLPLKEISELTGLGRPENASRLFKRYVGKTFTRYRHGDTV